MITILSLPGVPLTINSSLSLFKNNFAFRDEREWNNSSHCNCNDKKNNSTCAEAINYSNMSSCECQDDDVRYRKPGLPSLPYQTFKRHVKNLTMQPIVISDDIINNWTGGGNEDATLSCHETGVGDHYSLPPGITLQDYTYISAQGIFKNAVWPFQQNLRAQLYPLKSTDLYMDSGFNYRGYFQFQFDTWYGGNGFLWAGWVFYHRKCKPRSTDANYGIRSIGPAVTGSGNSWTQKYQSYNLTTPLNEIYFGFRVVDLRPTHYNIAQTNYLIIRVNI